MDVVHIIRSRSAGLDRCRANIPLLENKTFFAYILDVDPLKK